MALLINLRQLDDENLELAGELPSSALDLEGVDELIKLETPLKYRLEVQKLETSLLIQGELRLDLHCECARCLKPFVYKLDLPDWTCLLPMEGDEAAPIANDSIDLTPYVREDILLGFPQHPLCNAECPGLPKKAPGKKKKSAAVVRTKEISSTWAELNKLKF